MDDWRAEMLRRKQEDEIDQAVKEAGISGATYGGLIGGGGAILGGVRKWPKVLLTALTGAAGAGSFGALSAKGGTELMGAPKEDEDAAFTERGTLGGALLGGGIGALGGGLIGSGKLKGLLKYRKIADAWKKAESMPPLDSMVGDWARKLAQSPGGWKKVAALSGGVGAGLGAYQGLSEGMGVDAYRNSLKKKYQEMAANGDF